jgi:Tfp pilus assembly protein PilO
MKLDLDLDLGLWRRRLPLVAAALLFAGGNLGVFLTYRSSTQTRRAALEARRDELKKVVEGQEADAARVTGQQERLGGVSAAMAAFYGKRIGRERETLAPVVAEVHSILKETGVAAPQISYATSPVAKLPIVQMHINFVVHCDYPRFKRLLRAFETSKTWLVVRDVSISRDSGQPGQVQVQVELVTYFAEAEEFPAPPTEKPAAGRAAGGVKARAAAPGRRVG